MASFAPKDRTKLAAILGALISLVVELPLSDFESQANDSSAWQAQAQLSDIFKVKGTVENGVNFKMHTQLAIVHGHNFHDMFDQMMKYNPIQTELIESLHRNGGIMYMAVAAQQWPEPSRLCTTSGQHRYSARLGHHAVSNV